MTERKYLGVGQALPPRIGARDGSASNERRLLSVEQAADKLNLDEDEIRQLIATTQLTLIRIMGKQRIDSKDVDGLINAYKRTAMRRGFNPEQDEHGEHNQESNAA